jgi:hypothetical protein
MSTEQQGAKHAVHLRLVDQLERQAEDVQRLTSGLADEALSRRTVPDKWGLKELVCHIWRVQQVFDRRLDAMLSQDNPELDFYDPDHDPEFAALSARPAAETLSGFASDRTRLVSRLRTLSAAEWHRPGRHREYLHYDVHFLIEYLARHEAHHIYQMLQRRAPLGPLPH